MIPSRTVWGAILGLLLAACAVTAQIPRSDVYSRPTLPSTEALSRLNLRMAWRTYVPLDGRRDSIIRIELIGSDMFVLTRSGEVVRLDQETGEQKWRLRVGKPYTIAPFIAANSRSVYLVANAEIFGFDRARGTRKWDYPLRAGIAAAPAVDEEQVYLPGPTRGFPLSICPSWTRRKAEGAASAGRVSIPAATPEMKFAPARTGSRMPTSR